MVQVTFILRPTYMRSWSKIGRCESQLIYEMVKDKPSQNVRVVTAAGEDLHILYHVTARVKLNMVDHVRMTSWLLKTWLLLLNLALTFCDNKDCC